MEYQNVVKAKIKDNVFKILKGLPKQPAFVHNNDKEAATLWYNILGKYTPQQLNNGVMYCMDKWEKETWPTPQHVKYCVDIMISKNRADKKPEQKQDEYFPEPDWVKARAMARPISDRIKKLPEGVMVETLVSGYEAVFKVPVSGIARSMFKMEQDGVLMALTSIAHKAGHEGLLATEQFIEKVK